MRHLHHGRGAPPAPVQVRCVGRSAWAGGAADAALTRPAPSGHTVGTVATTSLLGNAILQRLEATPMSGYELKKRFSSSLGYGWRAYDTQIYRELKALEAAGLVSGRAEKGDRGPDRRIYSVTDAGRAVLVAWLQSPLDDTWYKSELTLRIWSMHLIPPGALDELLQNVE